MLNVSTFEFDNVWPDCTYVLVILSKILKVHKVVDKKSIN